MVGFTMLTGVAFADGPTPATAGSSATLAPGTLNISTAMTAGTFAGTLNGAAQNLQADGTTGSTAFSGFSVTDATGTGAGWNVTMQATQFTNTAASTSPSYGAKLPWDSLTMPQLAVVTADSTSSEVPAELNDAARIDNSTGTGVVMAQTDATGQGMGSYNFTAANVNDSPAPWVLTVPANTYAGTYTSTVTTTLATNFQ
jgi:hypothetical protein